MAKMLDAFGVALAGLRQRLRDGRAAAGEPLIVTTLANELTVSPTPVREALSRLAGEGMVEEHRGRGFYPLRFAASDVEELYRLHAALTDLSLTLRSERGERLASHIQAEHQGAYDATTLRGLTEDLWSGIARGGEAAFVRTAHVRLTNQLALARLGEAAVFDDLATELGRLSAWTQAQDEPGLRAALAVYHLRRRRAALAIAQAVHDLRALQAL